MSINLLRNSKVYFTTNVGTADPNVGVINYDSAFSAASVNTWEIQVLDDLSFNQTTAVETIAVNETGTAPIRGQRSFNTALNPVDFNFTTYMRPKDQNIGGAITGISVTFNGTAIGTGNPATSYGPRTRITCALPSAAATARAAQLYPMFGATGTATANQLVGIGIADGGAGYSTGALTFNIFDPDSTSESGTIAINIDTVAGSAATKIVAEESVLWNAMFSDAALGSGGSTAWSETGSGGSNPAICTLNNSNKHQMQRFGLIVIFDQNVFLLDDCSLNTATIDFGIDAIASIQWSGQARAVRRYTYSDWVTTTSWSTSSYVPAIKDAPFIANKLSTVTLKAGIGSMGTLPASGSTYVMPLTGGSITLTNNITYLTPAYMASVNQPITYFTGSRSITGSLSAYLRTGSGGTKYSADLFSDLVGQVTTDSDPEFYLQVEIGGTGSSTKVELEMPGVVLTIPTVNAESVITTTVNFTAQGTASNAFDIIQDNEIRLKYYA